MLRNTFQLSVPPVWRDHLNPLVRELFIKSVAVVRLVIDHARRRFGGQHDAEEALNELAFVRTGRGGIDVHRQPTGVHEHHDFHAFSGLRAANAISAAASLADPDFPDGLVLMV